MYVRYKANKDARKTPEELWKYLPGRMLDKISDGLPYAIPKTMLKYTPQKMSDGMLLILPNKMPDKLPELLSEQKSGNCQKKCLLYSRNACQTKCRIDWARGDAR